MPYALVGSAGTVQTGVSGAAVTPGYGAGAGRTAGNLLVLEVASTGSATLPAAISGWSIAKQQAGTSCSASIYYKIAAGADAAPTVPLVASAVHNAQLYEFSGGVQATPLDQTAGAAGTTTPIVGTAAAADAIAGNLVAASAAVLHSAARADASAHTFNNGVIDTETSNAATSTVSHYAFTYGVTTGKSAADSDSFAFTTTQLTGAAVAVASFKPDPTPRLVPVAAATAAATCVVTVPGAVAMMTTGFEHGNVTSQTTRWFWSSITGTPSVIAAAARNGSYGLRISPPANTAQSATYAPPVLTNTKIVMRVAFRATVLPATTPGGPLGFVSVALTTKVVRLQVDNNGILSLIDASSGTVTGPTIIANTWHVFELQIDGAASSNTQVTYDWKIDGVAQTQLTSAQTGGEQLHTIEFGSGDATYPAFTIDFDDLIIGTWTQATTDWFGDGVVLPVVIGADGTHSLVTNFSPGDAGAAYSGTVTNAFTMIDDPPPYTTTRSTTDNVAQRIISASAYLEFALATVNHSGVADAVVAILACSASGASAFAGCIARNSGGNVAVIQGDLPVAAGGNGGASNSYGQVANLFRMAVVPPPSAGWTAAEINAIRLRFGNATQVTNPPTVQAMMLEVDWPVAAPVLLVGLHHRRPQAVSARRDPSGSRARF